MNRRPRYDDPAAEALAQQREREAHAAERMARALIDCVLSSGNEKEAQP